MGCGQKHVRVMLHRMHFQMGQQDGGLGPELQVDRRALMILQRQEGDVIWQVR